YTRQLYITVPKGSTQGTVRVYSRNVRNPTLPSGASDQKSSGTLSGRNSVLLTGSGLDICATTATSGTAVQPDTAKRHAAASDSEFNRDFECRSSTLWRRQEYNRCRWQGRKPSSYLLRAVRKTLRLYLT